MVIACWSVKGGSGTTVVATALALRLARTSPTLLADIGGDAPSVLGCPEAETPGLADWFAAGPDVADDALTRLAVEAAPGLALVHAGSVVTAARPPTMADGERLVAALSAASYANAVVDCGSIAADVAAGIAASATRSLLVLRPCYLAMRHAIASPIRPSAVVLVEEAGRTLTAADVEDVLAVSVVTVPWHVSIARAVDSGLLAARLPRPLDNALRHAA